MTVTVFVWYNGGEEPVATARRPNMDRILAMYRQGWEGVEVEVELPGRVLDRANVLLSIPIRVVA